MASIMSWEVVISSLLTVNALILSQIYRRQGKIEEKLDKKQDVDRCKEVRQTCNDHISSGLGKGVDDLWDAFNEHSHEGLNGARVTR